MSRRVGCAQRTILFTLLAMSAAQSAFRIPPTFKVLPPREVIYSPGRPLQLPCGAIGFPPPRLEWYLNGDRLIVSRSNAAKTSTWESRRRDWVDQSDISSMWDLTDIFALGGAQSGWLYCVAVNALGRAISPPVWIKFAQIDESQPCETRTLIVREQPFVRLNCTVPRSTPPATVRWMFREPSGFMGFIHENRTFAMDDDGNLLIATAGLTPSSTLHLFCSASNPFLRTMRTDCDNIINARRGLLSGQQALSRPFIMFQSPAKQVRLCNETLKLRCLISPYPGTEIQWLWESSKLDSAMEWNNGRWCSKYNEEPPFDSNVNVKNEGTLLMIERLRPEHAGLYTCRTVNRAGYSAKPVSATFMVIVESIPTFAVMPVDTTVPIGETAQLQCEPDVSSGSSVDVKWYMNGEPIERSIDGIRKRLAGSSLILSSLGMHDSAVFQCNISNKHGFQFVNAYVNIWNTPPAILQGPSEEIVVAEGQYTNIPCMSVGAPTPQISWIRDGSAILVEDSERGFIRHKILRDGSLEIKNPILSDSGIYKCIVTNRFGSSSSSGKLVVRRATRVTSGPLWVSSYALQKNSENGTIYTTAGAEFSLICRAETDSMEISKMAIKWNWLPLSKPSPIQADGYFDLPTENIREIHRKIGRNTLESSLTLHKPLPSYSGTYRCQAGNGLDNDSRSIDVVIQGVPDPPIETALDCTQAAKKGVAVLSWSPGAENNAPLTDAHIEYAVGYIRPPAKVLPEIPNLQNPLNTRNLLEALNASLQRNGKGEWHTMKHSLHPGDDLAVVNLTQAFAIVPIYPDVAYQFRVRLVNVVGVSDPGSSVPGTGEEDQKRCILKPQAPTTKPEEMKIYGNVPNALTISWKVIPPIRHNGPGLRYHLSVKCLDCDQRHHNEDSRKEIIIYNWNQSQIVLTNLPGLESHGKSIPIEIFKQYEVSLSVSNVLGMSRAGPLVGRGWSAESPPTITPQRLRVTKVESTSAELVWEWPIPATGSVNGFFTGIRIEWCLDDKNKLCDRYKVTQDVKVAEPPIELFPDLRVDPAESEFGINQFTSSFRNNSHRRGFRSSATSYSQHRHVFLQNLPGMSRLRVWVRLLNIQYEGPSSDVLLIQTKEGVPESVSEFTHSFAGVNYVEVAWAKPLQTNGLLTGYLIDVIAGLDERDCDASTKECEYLLYQKKIEDPDQMATRLTGLEVNTPYKLVICATTVVGSGKTRELKVHTAKQRPEKSPAEFVVSPVYGSATTLNVSLVLPSEHTTTLNDENRHTLLQRDDAMPGSEGLYLSRETGDSMKAFLVQFKRLQDDQWEETEKEFDRDWQVVGSLIPGEEYNMRVIMAQSPSVSYVSPIRMLRVPRPGEIGFGLSGVALDKSPQGSLTANSVFSDSSLMLKIFVPLAVILFLLAVILTAVCCVRGPIFGGTPVYRLRISKPSAPRQISHRLNGCYGNDRHRLTIPDPSKTREYETAGNDENEFLERETVIYIPMGNSGDSTDTRLRKSSYCTGSEPSQARSRFEEASLKPDEIPKENSTEFPVSTSTFAPTRCLSPSFTLVPPMSTAPWQRLPRPDSDVSMPTWPQNEHPSR